MQVKRFLSAVFAAGLCLAAAGHAQAVLLDFEEFNLPPETFSPRSGIVSQGVSVVPQVLGTSSTSTVALINSNLWFPGPDTTHMLGFLTDHTYTFEFSGVLREIAFDFAYRPTAARPALELGMNLNGQLLHVNGTLVGFQNVINLGDVVTDNGITINATSASFTSPIGDEVIQGHATITGSIDSFQSITTLVTPDMVLDNILFDPVPEPASAYLLLTGAAAFFRRRSRC